MSRPEISVIITTYNRAEILPMAIESVISQTYDNFDVHIVDDCSSDNTPAIIKNAIAGKKNFYSWRHEKPQGLAAARNTGIANSKADFIAFLDDDDEWKPQCLEKRINILNELSPDKLKNLGVIYCGSQSRFVDEDIVVYHIPKIFGDIGKCLQKQNLTTIPSSCMFSRSALEKIGGFDVNLKSSVDHDIWMNLAVNGYSAEAVMEPLVVTYQEKNRRSMVTDTSNRIFGVEQYLSKWTPTFEQWFGAAGGRKYLRQYRTRILGRLTITKLYHGDFRQSFFIFRHILSKNNYSPTVIFILFKMLIYRILRTIFPNEFVSLPRKT